MNMDFGGYTRFPVEYAPLDRPAVPEWARQEHLEQSVSLREIWKYAEPSDNHAFSVKAVLHAFIGRLEPFRIGRYNTLRRHGFTAKKSALFHAHIHKSTT